MQQRKTGSLRAKRILDLMKIKFSKANTMDIPRAPSTSLDGAT